MISLIPYRGMRIITLLTLLLLALAPSVAFSHPVGAKGATMIMTNFMADRQDYRLNNTFRPRFALGGNYSHIKTPDDDLHATWLQINWLAKRWNLKNAQGNVYLQIGAGLANDTNTTQPLGDAEIRMDFETRRLYSAFEHQSLISNADLTNHVSQLTLGIAPYIAPYNSLHTWIIARGFYQPQMQQTWLFTPGLRFFYKTVFAEVGSSFEGDWFFNLMVQI